MVKNINQNNQSYWQCEECGFKYGNKEWAEKCEDWCREHQSCNLEITQHAIQEIFGKRKWVQKRTKREDEREKMKRKKKIKKLFSIGLMVLFIGGGISGLFWYLAAKPPVPESDVIARNGLHWHPEIKISILGKIQEIPANIGLGAVEKPIHTHDNMGVIHLEFQGLVKKDNARLGRFFEIWGKRFNRDCIFDKCNGPEGQVKMFVNNKENNEFENYIMRDGDKIEINFE